MQEFSGKFFVFFSKEKPHDFNVFQLQIRYTSIGVSFLIIPRIYCREKFFQKIPKYREKNFFRHLIWYQNNQNQKSQLGRTATAAAKKQPDYKRKQHPQIH